jgi:hypothetical protein
MLRDDRAPVAGVAKRGGKITAWYGRELTNEDHGQWIFRPLAECYMNQNEWYSVYTAALLEPNPTKLPTLIHDAETAIFSRIQSLSADPDASRERETIADALSNLRALQRNMLRYPGGREV